jgi:hypothetical protein
VFSYLSATFLAAPHPVITTSIIKSDVIPAFGRGGLAFQWWGGAVRVQAGTVPAFM